MYITSPSQAMLIGAFCYFNAEGELIRINSLALTPTPGALGLDERYRRYRRTDVTCVTCVTCVTGALRLDGAYPASPAAIEALTSASRMRPLTLDNLGTCESRVA